MADKKKNKEAKTNKKKYKEATSDKKKNKEEKAVVVELRVSMHCNACERTVAKAISKIKGVEKFTTEMKKHKVVVTGRINPEKFVKKLKKKTGKRVEIVGDKKESKGEGKEKDLSLATGPLLIDCWGDSEVLYTMFSDENANACSIM